MLSFERLDGPLGIPVFYQKLPDFVKSTAIALVTFVGSSDDTPVGEPGVYHWFEHVPFRGTQNLPGGYADTKGTITKTGGQSGAWTNMFCTNFWATVPTRFLGIALDVVVDLVAYPLLTTEGIEAERTIIRQEIGNKLGSVMGTSSYNLHKTIWPNHPYGHPVLGSPESLDSMTPETLWKARRNGYDRSRMAFFVSTSLGAGEILEMTGKRFGVLPGNGLSERRRNASYGQPDWTKQARTVHPTQFESSILCVLYPTPVLADWQAAARYSVLSAVFSQGGLGSPLYRLVREVNHLAYSAHPINLSTRDGGYFGFQVETGMANVELVEKILLDMKGDSQLRSREWLATVKDSARNSMEMEVVNPNNLVRSAIGQVGLMGNTIEMGQFVNMADEVSHDEIIDMIDSMTAENAWTVITLGK